MATESRFGDVPILLLKDNGRTTDWAPTIRTRTFSFLDGTSETQVIGGTGNHLLRVQHLVRTADPTTFHAFYALLGTEATLRVPYGGSTFPPSRTIQVLGERCKEFDAVLLSAIDDVRWLPGGFVYCRASFQRAVTA